MEYEPRLAETGQLTIVSLTVPDVTEPTTVTITWSKPLPLQLTVSGCERLTVESALKFVTVKLDGMLAVAVNGPTCDPPAPLSV
jgi:hypothetical protein